MRIDIMTLFPDSLGDVLSESILGRAQERGFIRIEAHQIRDYTASKQCQVDDYPYGGGRGAILQADPALPVLGACLRRGGRAGAYHLPLSLRSCLPAGGCHPAEPDGKPGFGLRPLRGD